MEPFCGWASAVSAGFARIEVTGRRAGRAQRAVATGDSVATGPRGALTAPRRARRRRPSARCPIVPEHSSSALRPRRWATLTTRSSRERYTVRSAYKRLWAWVERSPLTRSPLEEATTVFENSTACAPTIENRSWCASRFDPSRERFGEPGDGKESSREVPRHRWDHGVWVPITYDSFS
jgi:hypothetical protein